MEHDVIRNRIIGWPVWIWIKFHLNLQTRFQHLLLDVSARPERFEKNPQN
jgi:hypothetical protein